MMDLLMGLWLLVVLVLGLTIVWGVWKIGVAIVDAFRGRLPPPNQEQP